MKYGSMRTKWALLGGLLGALFIWLRFFTHHLALDNNSVVVYRRGLPFLFPILGSRQPAVEILDEHDLPDLSNVKYLAGRNHWAYRDGLDYLPTLDMEALLQQRIHDTAQFMVENQKCSAFELALVLPEFRSAMAADCERTLWNIVQEGDGMSCVVNSTEHSARALRTLGVDNSKLIAALKETTRTAPLKSREFAHAIDALSQLTGSREAPEFEARISAQILQFTSGDELLSFVEKMPSWLHLNPSAQAHALQLLSAPLKADTLLAAQCRSHLRREVLPSLNTGRWQPVNDEHLRTYARAMVLPRLQGSFEQSVEQLLRMLFDSDGERSLQHRRGVIMALSLLIDQQTPPPAAQLLERFAMRLEERLLSSRTPLHQRFAMAWMLVVLRDPHIEMRRTAETAITIGPCSLIGRWM